MIPKSTLERSLYWICVSLTSKATNSVSCKRLMRYRFHPVGRAGLWMQVTCESQHRILKLIPNVYQLKISHGLKFQWEVFWKSCECYPQRDSKLVINVDSYIKEILIFFLHSLILEPFYEHNTMAHSVSDVNQLPMLLLQAIQDQNNSFYKLSDEKIIVVIFHLQAVFLSSGHMLQFYGRKVVFHF